MKKNFFLAILVFSFGSVVFFSCQKDYNKPDDAISGIYGVKTEVSIRAIELDQFPAKDTAGANWDSIPLSIDSSAFPDIYYSFYHSIPDTNGNGYYQTTHFDNVNQDSLPIFYYITDGYKVYGFDSVMTMNVYDFEIDTVGNVDTTLMTSFNFQIAPGDSLIENPYPEFINVGDANYKLKLYLTWK